MVCRFWSEKKDRWIALVLFLCFQCLPATSIFFDSRFKDYLSEKSHFEQKKVDTCAKAQTRIDGINKMIGTIDNDLKLLKKDRKANSDSIMKILVAKRNTHNKLMESEAQNNIAFRQLRESEISGMVNDKKKLSNELDTEVRELANAQQSQLPYRSEIDFIISTFFTSKSYPSLFFAGLFPITLLAVGFFLSRFKDQSNNSSAPHFDLDCHLEKVVELLPAEMHSYYAKSLVPPLEAHLSVIKASREVLIENDRLHMNHALIQKVADEVQNMNKQISKSRLEAGAKNHLIASLKQILERNLIPREVKDHV